MNANGVVNKKLTDYWLEFYTKDGLCSLCGNSGVIDTSATAISPSGKDVGRTNFCICPNGQVFRKSMIIKSGDRKIKP